MKLHLTLAAFACAAVFAGPALAIEQIHIPDASAAQNSAPPDALFDNSIPTTWQKNSDEKQSGPLSNFHFSVSGGSSYGSDYQGGSSFGENAKVPNSEFYTNGVPLDDYPYAPH